MPECKGCKKDGTWTSMIWREGKAWHPECWVKKQKNIKYLNI